MEDAIDTVPARAGTPWHLWAVGLLSLLWNAFGGYDYTMTMLRDPGYLGMVAEQMNMPLPELLAFFDSFPAWAGALWAIGVWGSVLGSILLLIRSRHAVTAFLVSLVGAVLSFAYQFTIDLPPQMAADPMGKYMPIVIIVAIVLQWWYARRQAATGVLR
ncbi:hypothetical protein ACWPMX_02625 [Tsuneonella sp. HG094]|jgi:hypothetical protein